MSDDRKELLLKMYDQMFNDINRHILVVWQSVGVLVGSFAILALSEKGILNVDVGITLITLICVWLFAHLQDASYWYNRNLVIIANIERQFLKKEDLKEIHYYFGKHRPNNKMITHFRIQFALGSGILLVVLVYHFYLRVMPGLNLPREAFDPIRSLPYVAICGGLALLIYLAIHRNASYEEFLQNSPGLDISTVGHTYGIGHGHPNSK